MREVRDELGKLAGLWRGRDQRTERGYGRARSRSATMRRPPRCTKREPFLESPLSVDLTSQVLRNRRFRETS